MKIVEIENAGSPFVAILVSPFIINLLKKTFISILKGAESFSIQ
jgi:hypothetical protein